MGCEGARCPPLSASVLAPRWKDGGAPGRRCPPSRGSGACPPPLGCSPSAGGAVSGRGCPLRVGVGLRVPRTRRGGHPSPFSPLPAHRGRHSTLWGRGRGGGVSSPGVKTPAPELGVSAQVSASVVTSSPGLGLDKSLTSKACTALGPGLPPAGVTTVLSVAHWVSALTLEYLFLALWDALSPGSRLSAQPAPGVDFLLMSLLPQGLLGGTVELLWVSGTWSSLGGPSQVPALPAASAISWWRAAPVPLFLSRPCLSARG